MIETILWSGGILLYSIIICEISFSRGMKVGRAEKRLNDYWNNK